MSKKLNPARHSNRSKFDGTLTTVIRSPARRQRDIRNLARQQEKWNKEHGEVTTRKATEEELNF